jgi:hypothetical protein
MPSARKKKAGEEALPLNQSGKKEQAVSCCLLLLSKQSFFLVFKQHFLSPQ